MSLALRLSSAARTDYVESVEWYEKSQLGLGEHFGIAVSSALERISFSPETFPATHYKMRGEVIRRLLLSSFPFVIYFYRTSDEIVIAAIFHTSRDPSRIPLREDD